MSRPIRSFQEAYRKSVVIRRLKARTKGLGFWSALDAAQKYYNKDTKIKDAIPKRET